MATGKALDGKPYAGNPHVAPSQCYGGTSRFDEGEVASCTAEASLRRGHCRRRPEGRASVCAAKPRRGSLLYSGEIIAMTAAALMSAASAVSAADLETIDLQRRIDDAWRNGGGIVKVEAGIHRIGAIRLRSNVTLLLRSGAVLQASRNLEDYDGWANDELEPVARPQPGDPNDYMRNWYRALIRLHCATNAAVIGEPGSVIDGCNTFDPQG